MPQALLLDRNERLVEVPNLLFLMHKIFGNDVILNTWISVDDCDNEKELVKSTARWVKKELQSASKTVDWSMVNIVIEFSNEKKVLLQNSERAFMTDVTEQFTE